MKHTAARFFLLLSIVGVALALCACSNTFHGAGADIENAGESIQKNVPPQ